MTSITRRQFLQFSGVTLLAHHLPGDWSNIGMPAVGEPSALFGRTLHVASVYRTSSHASSMTERLWPDSIHPIIEQVGDWYHIPQGYVSRYDLQPMIVRESNQIGQKLALPQWAEVVAPVSAVYAWCALDAPLVTRIGHGGIMRVVDQVANTPLWYGLADEHDRLLGWTQAVQWQAISPTQPAQNRGDYDMSIDVTHQRLSITENQQPILQAAISTSLSIKPGVFAITEHSQGGTRLQINRTDYYGAPLIMTLDDGQQMSGAYWHNQFGTVSAGPAVQMSHLTARWLTNCIDLNEVTVIIG